MSDYVFSAYIANLGRYNEGYLQGEWVGFPSTKEKLDEAFGRIGIKPGSDYEEYMITEYDSDRIWELNQLLGEYENMEQLNYLAGRLQELSEEEIIQYNAIVRNELLASTNGCTDCINLTYNLDTYNWLPDVQSELDLGMYYVNNMLVFDVNSMGEFAMYFDYEAYGRDTSINEGGEFTEQGYICQTGDWKEVYSGNITDIPNEYRLQNGLDAQSGNQAAEGQLDKESIMQTTEEYMEQLTVAEELTLES